MVEFAVLTCDRKFYILIPINLVFLNKSGGHLRKGPAFTLAEVIITLGIVGVIAAISIPMLITATQKKVAETKLKHFYAEINQAFRLSANDNGVDVDGWFEKEKNYNEAEMNSFVTDFIKPYMSIAYTKAIERNPQCPNSARILVVLNNGTAFSMYVDTNGVDIHFHPDPNKHTYNDPRYSFAFQVAKVKQAGVYSDYNSMDFVQPYVMNWNGTMRMLKDDSARGCNRTSRNKQYCTKYIEMNDWKIPWDYPW